MPRPSSQSVANQSSRACVPSFFPAIAAHPARRSGSHHACRFRHHLHVVVMVVLFAACGIANAQPVAAAQSTVTSKSDRIERFVAEAALRFGIPTSWITAVMQAESRGVVRAVSPKGAMGLMQIMPDTWSGLRSRYGLGANPFDPHDNILAGAAYLRELHDRYGTAGFLAAYNAGPGRYEDHLASGRPLPAGDASLRRRARAVAARRRIGAGQRHHRDHPILDQFAVVSGARERRLKHRRNVIRRRRQTSIHGKAGDGLDGPCATIRRAVCASVGA